MPDITMCTNEECPKADLCWRFGCPPSQYRQSYAEFKFEIVNDDVECDYFIEYPTFKDKTK